MADFPYQELVTSVQRGVRWLKGASEELSEVREVAIAASAIFAAERNPFSSASQRLAKRLVKLQLPSGSWNEELWDTTWAARALHEAGMAADDTTMQAAMNFILATQDPITGSWYEEPFETIHVLELIAILRADDLLTLGKRALDWLCSLQNSSGMIIGARYTGMTVGLLRKVSKWYPAANHVTAAAVNWLMREAEAKEAWTSAAWSNAYALQGLLEGGISFEHPTIVKAINWFLFHQDSHGKWHQVSQIHDTAMAVMVLARLLTTPLVDVSQPRVGVLSALKENGTLRVAYQAHGVGPMSPSERVKLAGAVHRELSQNQFKVLSLESGMRALSARPAPSTTKRLLREELVRLGRYAYGQLVPARIQLMLERTHVDHLRIDVDERLADLPWELLHDGDDFLCCKYALGRRLISDQIFRSPKSRLDCVRPARILLVVNPTGDLPEAEEEGDRLERLFGDSPMTVVERFSGAQISKRDFLLSISSYDVVHYAGHARYNERSPDESDIVLADGPVTAFEIDHFLAKSAPTLVFLNACWSGEEMRNIPGYPILLRGFARTFLYAGVVAFMGYVSPIPDEAATALATSFYGSLLQGQSIGESLRISRVSYESQEDQASAQDLSWSTIVLYGDPTAQVLEASDH